MRKVLVVGLIVVVVVIGVGIFRIFSNLNTYVAAAIEEHGSQVTETAVRVSGVEISLREGSGTITGLRVANPQGFAGGDVFVLEDIRVDLDVGSVREDPIVLEQVRIGMPQVNAAFSESGKLNVEELRQRLQSAAGSGSPEGGSGPARKLRIQRFVFDGGSIRLDATALGLEERTLQLPPFRLDDVGGAGGVPPAEVARVVLTRVARQTAEEIARSEANRLIQGKLGDALPDEARRLLDKFGR